MPFKKDANLRNLTGQQLVGLHFEFHRNWGSYKRHGSWGDWSKEDFWNFWKRIKNEMDRRGFKWKPIPELDRMRVNAKEEITADSWDDLIESYQEDADTWSDVSPSGEVAGEEITLEELLGHFKPFSLYHPLIHLVGGIAIHGKTHGDIDIYIDTRADNPIALPIQFRILRMLPEELRDRVRFMFQDTSEGKPVPKQFTDYVPLFSIIADRVEPSEKIEMKTVTEDQQEEEEETLQEWPEDGEHPFVLQYHFRGKSVHNDIRFKFNDHLEGWAIASVPPGAIDEDVNTMGQAKKFIRTVDWKWPKKDVRAQAIKKSKQPPDWLEAQGVFLPGTVGASKFEEGVIVIHDHGNVEFGARKRWFFEYFVNGHKLKGRMVLRRVAEEDSNEGFWIAWLPEDQTPYVLSTRARREGWIPPKGHSALPEEIKKKVPANLQYWEEDSSTKRRQLRDELISRFNMEPEDTAFVLSHHWWKGKEATGADVEHYDLFIGSEMFVIQSDPRDGAQDSQVRKPYSKDFKKKGMSGPESIKPSTPGNPTKNTPCWLERIDFGEVTILEQEDTVRRFEFKGETLKGHYVMKRDDDSNLWKFAKTEETAERVKLSEESTQAFLSVEKFDDQTNKIIIEGTAFSSGVWNSIYYPLEVVLDRPERVIGIPVVAPHHEEVRLIGKVTKYYQNRTNGDIKVVVEITEPEGIQRVRRYHKEGILVGFSIELRCMVDRMRGICHKVTHYDRLAVVPDPACRVCGIDDFKHND